MKQFKFSFQLQQRTLKKRLLLQDKSQKSILKFIGVKERIFVKKLKAHIFPIMENVVYAFPKSSELRNSSIQDSNPSHKNWTTTKSKSNIESLSVQYSERTMFLNNWRNESKKYRILKQTDKLLTLWKDLRACICEDDIFECQRSKGYFKKKLSQLDLMKQSMKSLISIDVVQDYILSNAES
ncbi:hypothetical protein RFI_26580, partial [Reticulomyxa filosa]